MFGGHRGHSNCSRRPAQPDPGANPGHQSQSRCSQQAAISSSRRGSCKDLLYCRRKPRRGCPSRREFGGNLLAAGGRCRRLGCSGSACGLRHLGAAQGIEPSARGALGFGFLFGAAMCLPGRLFVFSRPRQCRGFGGPLGTQLLGGAICSELLGLRPLGGHATQLGFLLHTHRGDSRQFGRSAGAGLRCGQGALFRIDTIAQRGFRETLGLHRVGAVGIGFDSGSFCGGQGTCGFSRLGLAFGRQSCDGGTASFGFLFGAAMRLSGRLLVFSRPRQCRSLGGMLGTQLLGGAVGSELLGLSPLGGHAA